MPLRAFHDHAAGFTPIRSSGVARRFQFLEFRMTPARLRETLGTMAVADIFGVERQVTPSAAQGALSRGQQLERCVAAGGHGN